VKRYFRFVLFVSREKRDSSGARSVIAGSFRLVRFVEWQDAVGFRYGWYNRNRRVRIMQRGYGFGIWEEFCCRTWRVSRCSGSFPPLSTLGASLNGKALSDYNMDGIIETAGSELCGEGMALESGRSFVAVHGVFLGKARSDFDIIILDGTTVISLPCPLELMFSFIPSLFPAENYGCQHSWPWPTIASRFGPCDGDGAGSCGL
jgi:hypothetical protein